jgi:putative colanic acid biosynthesis UDP-glucose lipid carrier transferase
MVGRVSHDLYYIENWSLLLDLKILALTVLTGFAHKNAY